MLARFALTGSRKIQKTWLLENRKIGCCWLTFSVLEFGSASALPSITAALNGASFVCATDYPDDSLIENIHQNLQANLPDGSRFSAIGHQWGKPVSPILEANGGEPYDLILMADVVFNHTEQRSLLKSCVSCLAPGGVAFVSFSPHRPHLYEKDMRFFEIAREEFSLEVAQLPSLRRQVMFEMDPGDAELRATVFCFLLRRSS